MENTAKVSIIMLTYNSISKLKDFFDRVLTSLFNIEYSNVDIVFVDNNSHDGTVEYIRRYIDRVRPANNVKVLQLRRNYGWAGGNNRGAVVCRDSDYLMFINDDVILRSDVITKMVKILRRDRSIGAAQPLIKDIDGDINCGFKLSLAGFAKPVRIKKFRECDIIETFYAMGSALITRTRLFFRVGMFDEDYFYWYDDVDYCWRIRALGYKVVCIPSTEVIHYGSATFGKRNPVLYYYWVKNDILMSLKNYDWTELILTSPLRMLEIVIGALGHNLLAKDPLGIKSTIKGLIDSITGSSTFLRKRAQIKKLKADEIKMIKFLCPDIDADIILGWLLRRN